MRSGIAQGITLRMPLESRIAAITVLEGKAGLKEVAGKADRRELTLAADEPVRIKIILEK